jgi:RecG-like helicase
MDLSQHLFVQVEWLGEKMLEANFTVCAMHGEMEQAERDKIMKDFRAGTRWRFCEFWGNSKFFF